MDLSVEEGTGDMDPIPGSKCVVKRFCNGVKVPVFIQDPAETSKGPSSFYYDGQRRQRSGHPDPSSSLISLDPLSFLDHFTCPICMDPMVEVTTTECGHTFCGGCIQTWMAHKPICPICSKELSKLIRLYSQDQMLEHIILSSTPDGEGNFPTDLQDRMRDASDARLTAILGKSSKGGRRWSLARLRTKLDDVLLSCRCKGVYRTFKAMAPSRSPTISVKSRLWMRSWMTPSWSLSWRLPSLTERSMFVGCGVLIGVVATLGVVNYSRSTQFLYYVYLCLKNYDGTIPPYLNDGVPLSYPYRVTTIHRDNFTTGGDNGGQPPAPITSTWEELQRYVYGN